LVIYGIYRLYLHLSIHFYYLLAILLRAGWICSCTAIRSPSKRFPRLRWHLIEKNEIFLDFQIYFLYLNRPQMRANILQMRKGSQRCGSAVKTYSARGETRAVDEIVRTAMMIWVFLIDYARRMRRLTINISWIDRFFIKRCD